MENKDHEEQETALNLDENLVEGATPPTDEVAEENTLSQEEKLTLEVVELK